MERKAFDCDLCSKKDIQKPHRHNIFLTIGLHPDSMGGTLIPDFKNIDFCDECSKRVLSLLIENIIKNNNDYELNKKIYNDIIGLRKSE